MTATIHAKPATGKRVRPKAGAASRSAKASALSPKPGMALDLRKRLALKQALFARLLPVSVRSLASLEGGSPPTEAVARRLTELLRLTNALAEVMRKESLGKWLQTPNDALDGLKPLEVIDRGESDRIWSMIYFLRSGVPS